MRKTTRRFTVTGILQALALLLCMNSFAQVYQHDFGTDPITAYPYTGTPVVQNGNITNAQWTNNIGIWTSLTGYSGQAITHAAATSGATLTLNFDVASGKELSISAFNFWRMRSAVGPQSWAMTINGMPVGNGSVPLVGTEIGETAVPGAIMGLTGTVTVTITLSDPLGSGSFSLDNFTLIGSVTDTCVPPVVTSIFPTTAPAEAVITIMGSGFMAGTGTSAVLFNGVPATGFTVIDENEIKAVVPQSAGTGVVTVTTDDCDGASSQSFTFIVSDCPNMNNASELFISELYDHNTGSWGAIELYNPTPNTITFNGQYVLQRAGTIGGAVTESLVLPGSVEPFSTYIVRFYGSGSNPGPVGCAVSYQANIGSGINENDQFFLVKNGVTIDESRAPNFAGYTVKRNASAPAPSTSYNVAFWTIGANECSNLGIHNINLTSLVSEQPESVSVCEGDSASFSVSINNPSGFTYQWKMLDAAGNWVNVTNNSQFSGANTNTLTVVDTDLPLNASQYYCEMVSASCTLVSNAAQLTVSPLPVAIVMVTTPTCTPGSGSLEVTAAIGDGLTFSIDGSTYTAGTTITGLDSGSYTLYIQSSTGCIATMPVIVPDSPLAPDTPTLIVTQPDCSSSEGSIEVTAPIEAGLEYSINGIDFQTSPLFENLSPGSYTITVENALGCTADTTAVEIDIAPIIPDIATTTVTQPTCTAGGIIEITSPLGAEYTYSVNGIDFQTEPLFTGLLEGMYSVIVNHNTGCASVTPDIMIEATPTPPATPVATVTQATCTTGGTIEITSPTDPAYTYSINGTDFQTELVFNNVAAGDYTITVDNGLGCTATSTVITIDPAPNTPVVATTTVTQPTCAAPTGSIEITAPLGMQYSINGGAVYQTATNFSGLTPGQYTVTVMNADGCTSQTAQITIDAITPPAVATTTVTQPSCTDGGMIEVTAPAGMQYSIDGTNFQTDMIFTGLAQGTYNVTVMNAEGCTSVTPDITINVAPAVPAVATTTVTQPTCTEGGTIEVTAPTGAGLQYSIDGINYQAETTFTGLIQGTYTVMVMSPNNCTSTTADITINPGPISPAPAVATVTQPTCGEPTGTIEISSPIGAGITYSINGTDYQSATTFTNVAPGTYIITTEGVGGCTSESAQVTVNSAAQPDVATYTVTQPTCAAPQGIIEVIAPLGAEYTYSIDGINFQAGTTFTAPQGTYTLTVSNTDGCSSATADITIDAAPAGPEAPVAVVAQQPTCTTPTGTIEVTSPLDASYQYSVDGVNYQSSATFTGLTPGQTYTVSVMGADGCSTTAASSVTIDNLPAGPAVATTTVTQPTCMAPTGTIEVVSPLGAGYTYSVDGSAFQSSPVLTGLNPGDTYYVTVMNADGCTSVTTEYIMDVLPAGPDMVTVLETQPTCALGTGSIEVLGPFDPTYTYSVDGVTFQQGTIFANLVPGTYAVTCMDGNGCTSQALEVILDEPAAPEVADVLETQTSCVEPLGALEVLSPVGAGYSYSINGVDFQDTRFFTNLAPGVYTVHCTNPEGCTSVTQEIVIDEVPTAPLVTGVQGCEQTSFGATYTLTANAVSDSDVVSYTWRRNGIEIGSGESFDAGAYVAANNLRPEDFPIQIAVTIENAVGCTADYVFDIEYTFCDIPRGISPNNDGDNDTFDLTGMGAEKVTIFNRYGREVYSRANYTNEWMGQTDSDEELPTGTYFYVVELPSGPKTGWVYIQRQQ